MLKIALRSATLVYFVSIRKKRACEETAFLRCIQRFRSPNSSVLMPTSTLCFRRLSAVRLSRIIMYSPNNIEEFPVVDGWTVLAIDGWVVSLTESPVGQWGSQYKIHSYPDGLVASWLLKYLMIGNIWGHFSSCPVLFLIIWLKRKISRPS